jgi:hypothetical protein
LRCRELNDMLPVQLALSRERGTPAICENGTPLALLALAPEVSWSVARRRVPDCQLLR